MGKTLFDVCRRQHAKVLHFVLAFDFIKLGKVLPVYL